MRIVRVHFFVFCLSGIFLLLLIPFLPAKEPSPIENLFSAVEKGDPNTLADVLHTIPVGAITGSIKRGVSPLHLAAALNNRGITEMLLAAGADINQKTEQGFTPLHWAASKNAVDAATALIGAGADVNAEAPFGITPLHWAAGKDACDMVKLLILADADCKKKTTKGFTPLHWAVQQNSLDSAQFLAEVQVTEEISKERELMKSGSVATDPFVKQTVAPATDAPSVEHPKLLQSLAIPVAEPGGIIKAPLGMQEEIVLKWIAPLNIWVGVEEISNGQFRRFRNYHSSRFVESFSLNERDQPAVYVSWEDATAFCDWLNAKQFISLPAGYVFRLPTEAEWETFASCGTKRIYPWGDELPPLYGNYSDISAQKNIPRWKGIKNYDDGFPVTCPVNMAGTNDWELCGVGGNVWEWCSDWFDDSKTHRVRRGGSWFFDDETALEISYRGMDKPTAKYDTVGFRVVAAPPVQRDH